MWYWKNSVALSSLCVIIIIEQGDILRMDEYVYITYQGDIIGPKLDSRLEDMMKSEMDSMYTNQV